MRRTTIAQENKSWESHEVDVGEIIRAAYKLDERLACIIAMVAAFGLRTKEAIEIRPSRAYEEGMLNNSILVEEGTKGGRPRYVNINTKEQGKILAWAIEVGKATPSNRLRWPSCSTWPQAQRYFYKQIAKLGITQTAKGVTMHGLRHQFAQKNYRLISGLPSPIEGGALPLLDKLTHRASSQYVSSQLGHCREDIGATYYGSYGHRLRGIPDVPTGQPLKEEKTPLATDVAGTEGEQP